MQFVWESIGETELSTYIRLGKSYPSLSTHMEVLQPSTRDSINGIIKHVAMNVCNSV